MADKKPSSVTCVTCGKPFDPATSPALPFCSHRCRRIDLRRWLQEEISMPSDSEGEDAGPSREQDEE